MIIVYGEPYSSIDAKHLNSTLAHQIFRLVISSAQRDFEIIGISHISNENIKAADVIIVDCLNDQVPNKNQFGIKNRERFALVFPIDESVMPSVFSLRTDFPITLHQNRVVQGHPADICLYFEPWTAVQRSWTAQKHLQRILWWLSKTSKGLLHRGDQVVEQLYFSSETELVLPPNFDDVCQDKDYVLNLSKVQRGENEESLNCTFIGDLVHKSKITNNNLFSHKPIVITLPAIVHCGVEYLPNTLGDLHDQLFNHKVPFFQHLCEKIRSLIPSNGITHTPKEGSLIILNIPIKRTEDSLPEKFEVRAFITLLDIAKLGEKLDILDSHATGMYCAVQLIGGGLDEQQGEWRDVPILSVSVKKQVTYDFVLKASGITEKSSHFHAVLAGVGALGSSLAELWSREAWGKWTIVDPDHVEPHNVVRHIAKNSQIGTYKVDAVKQLIDCNFYESGHGDSRILAAIPKSILDLDCPDIQNTINSANFLVDVTTTLYVPRDLSQNDNIPRSVSVFLTPSGVSSVLLLEDAKRKVRLQSLEAQYYRAVINNDWGKKHLEGHHGKLWVGAGCRDVSAIISFETVQLHASILAQQIRLQREQDKSKICIWELDPGIGSVSAHTALVSDVITTESDSWQILWDVAIQYKLKEYRAQHLPDETGGVIVGYIDQKLHSIFVVDILSSPPDSKSGPSEFVRGACGLEAKLKEIAKRTANIVGYIGEWHSHPSSYSAQPSSTDHQLIKSLAETLYQDGQPALMIIVGSNEISVTVRGIL